MNVSSILKTLKSKISPTKTTTPNNNKPGISTDASADSSFILGGHSSSLQNSSILSETLDISQYLEYEWFDLKLFCLDEEWWKDLEPKTDYTYSRSVSYNNAKGDKVYISPNMSRRRIHIDATVLGSLESPQKKTPTSTHWLRSREKVTDFSTPHHLDNTYTDYLSENLHNEHLETSQASATQTSNLMLRRRRRSGSTSSQRESSSNSKTVTTITNTVTEIYEDLDGQIEKGMKETNASKAGQDDQSPSPSPSIFSTASTASREMTRETVTTDYLIKDKSADIYHNDNDNSSLNRNVNNSHTRIQSTSSSSKKKSSNYNKNQFSGPAMTTSDKSSGYLTLSSNTSKKQYLTQKMAAAAAALYSTSNFFTKDTTTTVKHMYGLDSDTEYEYDDVSGSFAVGNQSTSSRKYSTSGPNFATSETALNEGIFWRSAKGAKNLCTKTVSTVVEVVEWLTIGTAHKLSSLLTSRRLCCCCLPLLLLLFLPFLLGGLWEMAALSSKNSTTIINQFPILSSFLKKREVIVIGKSASNELELEKQIELLSLQMQETREKQNAQLSRADVEAMIKMMSVEQLTMFMGRLDQNEIKHNQQLENWKKEQLSHFEIVNNEIKLLFNKAEDLNTELKATKNSLGSQSSASSETQDKINLLEESLNTLVGEFSHLKNFQLEYYNLFKNCCQNATSIQSGIKQEVYAALMKVLGGKASGDSGTAETVVQQTLTTWLHDNYISRSELESQLNVLAKSLTKKLQDMLSKEKPNSTVYLSTMNSGITESFVRALVDEALVKFSADKTGMADFALESGGGSIISTRCSETFTKRTALVSMFGIPLFYKSNSPRTTIQPEVNPGECWAFKGSIGTLVIQLSRKIQVTAFTLEHIPKSLSPHGQIDSAPKDFSVYALNDLNDLKGVCLGNYSYQDDGRPLQQFPVQVDNPQPTQLVEVRISSNHGNLEFTCLYRFRVHGLADKS